MLYLSGVPFEQLGFKAVLEGSPYPKLTWNVLSKIPNVVSVAGVMLFGIWWLTGRKEQVAEAEQGGTPSDAETRRKS